MAASSPAKFLFGFLLVSIILWLLFVFASRLVAWLLSRILGASVTFRVGGWKCLRDIVVKFKKGPIESVCISEIKVSLRQSLVKLGAGFFSRDPKLQVLITELEIVIRPSSTNKDKSKSRRTRSSGKGKGKLMVVANMARFLSVSITDLAVKAPKATVEIKDLNVELSKDAASKSNLSLKLHVVPITIHLGDPQVGAEQSSGYGDEGSFYPSQTSAVSMERSTAPFSCEDFLLSCEFGPDREAGVSVKNLDIIIGEVTVNLNEALLSKSKTSTDASSQIEIVPAVNSATASKKQNKKQVAVTGLAKYTSMIPEKVSFCLPKLDVKFVQQEHNLFIENNIMGIQLKCMKARSSEDVGESTRLDIQIDFSEIHLLRESSTSVIEILKLDVASLVYIPVEPTSPVRAEVDVKLGGTQFNLLMSRLKPWLQLQLSKKKKKMVLRDGTIASESSTSPEPKIIMWTCTVSAPEMTLVLYSINNLPLYHGCSQSLHIFANNISNTGTAVHLELGELNLYMEDEYQDCLKENLFGVEANSGSLMHVAKVGLDWGKKDVEGMEEDVSSSKLALSVDVTGVGISFTFKRVESLISTALSFQALLKNLSSRKKETQSHGSRASSSGKGTRLLKFNLERCSVNLCGEAGLENSSVADPKRVNYGSQGGKMVISVSADGTPRTASVMSTISEEHKKLKYTISLDIFHLTVCVNKEKQYTQMELERARSVYEDSLTEHKSGEKVTLFDMQNAKYVRRSGGLKEISLCSLFSAADIAVRWEPDLHLSLVELGLHIKSLIEKKKLQQLSDTNYQDVPTDAIVDKSKEMNKDSGQNAKTKKKESIFAVDIEKFTISAEAGDGVEALVQVQSIFSENARIGVLLEGLLLSFNGVRVFKSSRMQVSRIPRSSTSSSDAKLHGITTWDWMLQGLDIHVSMPYRLQLRAIDDSVEDMLRALKLIAASKTKLFFPSKTEGAKPKKPSSTKLGSIKICVRKLTADIEEEPMQGWLDEHYQLLKNESCELAVRLKYLDDILKGNQHSGNTDANDCTSEKKLSYDGLGVDFQDSSSIGKIQEELYRQSFRSYYQACQNLKPSEGSGACNTGFQAGFRPSASRTSLLSVSASELDLTLTSIEGGDDGMIELLGKLDPISREYSVPFSRLYGSNVLLRTSCLTVQLRDYTYPLFSATSGKCEGCVILAQQATYFQPQVYHDVYVGKWRKVQLLRSASGTTPPLKTYLHLPIYFQKGEISFGVGYEPCFADVGYAFTVALRRANLSVRNPDPNWTPPPKKEKSLPWWDDMRQYIHGNISLLFNETRWCMLATTDPYEKLDKLQFVSGHMEIKQSDGRIYLSAKDFKIFISSLESLGKNRSLKLPVGVCDAFLETPEFVLEVLIDWDCESGTPLNHYLFAFPNEGKTREIVFDPYRSTSLSLRWNILAKPVATSSVGEVSLSDTPSDSHVWPFTPTFKVGPHDLAWITKFWMLQYAPPHKLRSFSRFPRFGVPRFTRSGNLSLDRVLTEFMLRIDVTPACIKHVALFDDDPAKGLVFRMTKLKYEMYQSRGKQTFTFDCKREPLDMVYRGFDIHMLRAFLDKASENQSIMSKIGQTSRKPSQSAFVERALSEKGKFLSSCTEKNRDDGFLLSSDYFTIRKQAPKADPARLLAWQEAGRKNVEMTYVRSEFENGSESDEHARSDQSDDDGYNVVIADNCQRVFVYGLKLLWTIENRDAVWSWVGGLSKAFESPKPSPSLLYAQRKLHQQNEGQGGDEVLLNDKPTVVPTNPSSSSMQSDKINVLAAIPGSSSSLQNGKTKAATSDTGSNSPLVRQAERISSPSHALKRDNASSIAVAKNSTDDPEEEGTRHFMVNVIEPQFNLHSDEANGRFLLAAVSGRVLARSFHSILHVGLEMIQKAFGKGDALGTRNGPVNGDAPSREFVPEMTWKRMELSVMLEHVQAHVAPTDVDPGAGLQWLPKISRSSAKVKRTGALLERVFMPCDMYFQYTRHKGGTPDLKMKPLKELAFNSHDITATMTSRQFQVMLDVLTNLLFARLPKPRRSSLTYPVDDDDDVEEEADEVVPYGVEEVELAKINLEKKEREQKLLIDDIRKLSYCRDAGDSHRLEGDLWMIRAGKYSLVKELKRELANIQKSRKEASSALRMALQKAAQLRLMEKEKNKSPSYAMRISLQITKVVWGMLIDGKPFAEAEINDLIYDFDRDYKDVGVALFTTKSIVVRNCLPNAKSDMLLSAWNPPPEWGKKLMLRVDAKQGAPKDGHSPLELFQVEIYPLKIYLTETMYRMMWEYLFPAEEQDSQRRQEVWKISTTAGSKRVKKGSTIPEASTSFGPLNKDSEISSKLPNTKTNVVSGSAPELRRTSSFDRSWEETVAESVANELVLQAHSSSRSGPLGSAEQADESTKKKDSRSVKSGRTSYEDKKVGKAIEEKRSRPRKLMEFHNIKISQVELCVTYEGSRFVVNELKLLMDTFHRDEFIGTWRRLFSRVKKHIIWGVLKSVTGMQGKKFKDKGHSSKNTIAAAVPDSELNFSDNEGVGPAEKNDQFPIAFAKRKEDVAGDGFVTSIKGLFNTQRRRAKKFVLRTMRGEENDYEWSESDVEFSPFARQLTITKAKKLIRRHTKKFRNNKGTKGSSSSQQKEDLPASPMDPGFESDSSGGSSPFEDFHEELHNAI